MKYHVSERDLHYYNEGLSRLPKIPFQLLSDFIAIARHYAYTHRTEVHGDLYWSRKGFYYLDIPQQEVHRYWVVPGRPDDELSENMRKIGEIHSHHFMVPIPSPTDDENETAPILYAIVGNMDKFFPDITLRTWHKGVHITLDPQKVFESPFQGFQYDLEQVEISDSVMEDEDDY